MTKPRTTVELAKALRKALTPADRLRVYRGLEDALRVLAQSAAPDLEALVDSVADVMDPVWYSLEDTEAARNPHWQREMPRAEGTYYVRTLDGLDAGQLTVTTLPDGALFTPVHVRRAGDKYTAQILAGTAWCGWWWPVPIPSCPSWEP